MDVALAGAGSIEGSFVDEPHELDQAQETLLGGSRRSVSRIGSKGSFSSSKFFRRVSSSKMGRSLSGRVRTLSRGSDRPVSAESGIGLDPTFESDRESMLPATGRRTASVSARLFGGRSKPTPLPTHIEDHSEDDGLGEEVRSPEVSISDEARFFTESVAPKRRPRSAPSLMHRERGEFVFDDSFESSGSETVPLMAQFDDLGDMESQSAASLYKDLSGYEIDLLLNLLADEPDLEAKLDRWMELILSGDKDGARREVQEYINSHVGFRDTLSIAFHEGIQNWKDRSGKERAIAAGKYTGELVFSPLITGYQLTKATGKFAVSKEYRDAQLASGKEFMETGHVSYQTRKKFASACLKVGVGTLVSTVIAAEVGSAGMATPAIAAGGVLVGVGVAGAVANGVSRRKAPALVLGEIIGDSTEAAGRAAVMGGLLGALGEVGSIIATEIGETDQASLSGSALRGGESVTTNVYAGVTRPEVAIVDTIYERDLPSLVHTANREGRADGRWRS
ncbi:MAG: hypothetical protein S4CHLAM37_04490 [Chlamydiia bacterium]|nr:hypothetical protein [Chlamydiia bacterium]